MKIALGCDHGGYELKEYIKPVIEKMGHEFEDFGCYNLDSCDYPDFGAAAAKAVAEGKCDMGIVSAPPASVFPSLQTRSRASAAPTAQIACRLR